METRQDSSTHLFTIIKGTVWNERVDHSIIARITDHCRKLYPRLAQTPDISAKVTYDEIYATVDIRAIGGSLGDYGLGDYFDAKEVSKALFPYIEENYALRQDRVEWEKLGGIDQSYVVMVYSEKGGAKADGPLFRVLNRVSVGSKSSTLFKIGKKLIEDSSYYAQVADTELRLDVDMDTREATLYGTHLQTLAIKALHNFFPDLVATSTTSEVRGGKLQEEVKLTYAKRDVERFERAFRQADKVDVCVGVAPTPAEKEEPDFIALSVYDAPLLPGCECLEFCLSLKAQELFPNETSSKYAVASPKPKAMGRYNCVTVYGTQDIKLAMCVVNFFFNPGAFGTYIRDEVKATTTISGRRVGKGVVRLFYHKFSEEFKQEQKVRAARQRVCNKLEKLKLEAKAVWDDPDMAELVYRLIVRRSDNNEPPISAERLSKDSGASMDSVTAEEIKPVLERMATLGYLREFSKDGRSTGNYRKLDRFAYLHLAF